MKNSLSIRAYTKQLQSHTHEDYHQMVLPLQGSIEITMPHYSGKVVVGDCVVICAGRQHAFKADEEARFIVADLLSLPVHLHESETPVFRITPHYRAFSLLSKNSSSSKSTVALKRRFLMFSRCC